MIKHAWSVLCGKSIIDKDTNNISLDVLEEITLGILPIPEAAAGVICPIQFEVVSLWYRDDIDHPESTQAHINIMAPNGQRLGRSDFEVNLSAYQRLRTRSRIGGIPIPSGQSGRFQFIVEFLENDHWKEVAWLPLSIVVQQRPAADLSMPTSPS